MDKKKPAGLLLPILLILIFAAAACTPRHTGAGTTAAAPASTALHSDESETSASAAQTGESTQKATSTTRGVTETSSTPATTRTQPTVTTKPAQTTSTTSAAVPYAEWTYRNRFGNTVTYSENPGNPYIRLVSLQTGIPAKRLSVSFWSQGAAVFVFRSADRNTDTLDSAYFILSEDMEIFTVSGEQAEAEYSKFSRETAIVLYEMALEHRP